MAFAGPKNRQGPPGEDGPRGQSAYEVAVENGFRGSEQDWLDSLIGPRGPKGPKGEKGDPGETKIIYAGGLSAGPQDGGQSDSAKRLEDDFIAGENISALKLFYINDDQEAMLADNSDYGTSQVIGISLTAAASGGEFRGLLFGRISDPLFSYPSNTSLYLGSNGSVTNVVPTSGTRTKVGHALYSGAIFLKIEDPINLA